MHRIWCSCFSYNINYSNIFLFFLRMVFYVPGLGICHSVATVYSVHGIQWVHDKHSICPCICAVCSVLSNLIVNNLWFMACGIVRLAGAYWNGTRDIVCVNRYVHTNIYGSFINYHILLLYIKKNIYVILIFIYV